MQTPITTAQCGVGVSNGHHVHGLSGTITANLGTEHSGEQASECEVMNSKPPIPRYVKIMRRDPRYR
jgi:hypothetical protein